MAQEKKDGNLKKSFKNVVTKISKTVDNAADGVKDIVKKVPIRQKSTPSPKPADPPKPSPVQDDESGTSTGIGTEEDSPSHGQPQQPKTPVRGSNRQKNNIVDKASEYLKPAVKEVKEMFKSKPEPDTSFDPLPVIEPTVIQVKLPNPGGKDQSFPITIKHTGKNRVLFKIRGTKQKAFRVEQTYGFVEPGVPKVVRVQPNKIKEDDDECVKGDHFTVLMAPIPHGQEKHTDPKDVWSKEPTPVKTFIVPIEWLKAQVEKQKQEHKPSPQQNASPAKKEPAESLPRLVDAHYDELSEDDQEGDIGVNPDELLVMVPCAGTDKDIQCIYIRNPTDDRLVFKLKCTQTVRFKMVPAMGFVEPKARSKIEVRPIKFDQTDDMGFASVERLTIIIGKAPSKSVGKDARQVWAKDNPHEPNAKELKLHKVAIHYGKMEGKDEQNRKKRIVKTETGFKYETNKHS